MNSSYYAYTNINQFQTLMYQPLYWFGDGSSPTLDAQLSLARPPIYNKDHDTIVIDLKRWKWSDGETLDASDVLFWMNMLRAETVNWGDFTPGEFPDNVRNVVVDNPTRLTFYLNRPYNPTWFTYNQLSQIVPMPAAWDVRSLHAAPGSGRCATAAYASIVVNSKTNAPVSAAAKACNSVYDFLSTQAGYNPLNPTATNVSAMATYATNPLWHVVDGPWHLESFEADGRAVFVPNRAYSGQKPRIAKFIELPFTSATAEYDALVAGAVDVGYLPFSEVQTSAPRPGVAGPNNATLARAYNLKTGFTWTIDYFLLNFKSTGDGGEAGAIYRQLYFRQALQNLIDQPAIISKIYRNYGVPTYGPVPLDPPTWAAPSERTNPYPYDPARARSLLRSHGWDVVPEGTSRCLRGGAGRGRCGTGVRTGARLSFQLQYVSSDPSMAEVMSDEEASWASAGIEVLLRGASQDEIFSVADPCASGCPWQMENWNNGGDGQGWIFAFNPYPTGGTLFKGGSAENSGSYDNAAVNKVIEQTHLSPSRTVFDDYQGLVARQLPVVFQPGSLPLVEVKKGLNIGPLDPLAGIIPSTWYFGS